MRVPIRLPVQPQAHAGRSFDRRSGSDTLALHPVARLGLAAPRALRVLIPAFARPAQQAVGTRARKSDHHSNTSEQSGRIDRLPDRARQAAQGRIPEREARRYSSERATRGERPDQALRSSRGVFGRRGSGSCGRRGQLRDRRGRDARPGRRKRVRQVDIGQDRAEANRADRRHYRVAGAAYRSAQGPRHATLSSRNAGRVPGSLCVAQPPHARGRISSPNRFGISSNPRRKSTSGCSLFSRKSACEPTRCPSTPTNSRAGRGSPRHRARPGTPAETDRLR